MFWFWFLNLETLSDMLYQLLQLYFLLKDPLAQVGDRRVLSPGYEQEQNQDKSGEAKCNCGEVEMELEAFNRRVD